MKVAMLPKSCSMQSPIKIPIPFIREIKKINPIIHLSAQKAVNRQSNTKYRAKIEVSQYTTSNFTTEK
jgi:hypothetical protein